MINFLKIPLCTPFKFVPSVASAGVHFDDDWACRQIKSFESRGYYAQKWIRSKTTPIQVTATVAPMDVFVYDVNGDVVKNIAWSLVVTGPTYNIYEATIDFSDLDEGRYFLYILAELLSFSKAALSEPIDVKDSHDNVLEYKFKNSFNDFGVAWTTGIEMSFFVESAIMEFSPARSRTAYTNQNQDVFTLKATPFREFKLWVGEGRGVADWVIDLMNRIWCCDSVKISRPGDDVEKNYQSTEGAKWEVTRVKGWPLIGATLEITEQYNNDSLEMADGEELTPGLVTAFNIETDFFGPGATVNVTDLEENS